QARVWLVRYLGEHRRLDSVSVAGADAYKGHMIQNKLSKATIAKRGRDNRHFFENARRRGLVDKNSLFYLQGAVKGDSPRRVFVAAADVEKVIAEVPDPQWKLLIALARYGGLRVPSEPLALTWRDVDFEHKRFIVRASKTAHHQDNGVRVVPM